MTKPLVTIFTPTFNRAYILPKLYESLKAQKSFDFEWIIVDDGSTDNTKELVKGWQKENNPFQIRYIKTQNGGKHRAINLGVKLASSKLFFIIDSDDQIAPKAIPFIYKMNKTAAGNNHLAGFSGTRITPSRKVIGGDGNLTDWHFVDASNLERKKYNLLGDKAEIYYTNILRKYPFPEFEGENYLDEGIVWNKIARDGYKIRWFNKPLCICEYRPDGLTNNLDKKNIENPKGFSLYIRDKVSNTKSLLTRIRAYSSYYSLMNGTQSKDEIKKALNINSCTLFVLMVISAFRHNNSKD